MADTSWLGPTIEIRPVLAEQQTAFIDLLRRLDADEWALPTACPGWTVKDIAAHVHRTAPRHQPTATLVLDADTTWRLCTRGISPDQAAVRAVIDGDQHLATTALQIVSIIWARPSRKQE